MRVYTCSRFMAPNIPDVHYEACWTENDGIYSCGCEHPTIYDAMRCLVPDGSMFIRAVQDGISRSLNDTELIEFLAASSRRFRKTLIGSP